MHKNLIAEAILEVVPFGTWAELHIEDVEVLGINVERAYLCSNENYLLANSKWVTESGVLVVSTYLKEYGHHMDLHEFLIALFHRAGHTARRDWADLDEFLALQNPVRNVPVVRLSQLNEAYHRAVKAHRLFAEYGLIEESKVTSHE